MHAHAQTATTDHTRQATYSILFIHSNHLEFEENVKRLQHFTVSDVRPTRDRSAEMTRQPPRQDWYARAFDDCNVVKCRLTSVVLITGASAGIGASTAILFAKAGVANLILTARRADKLAEVKKSCESAGKAKVVLVEADMMKTSDLDQILPKAGLKVDM